MEIVKKGVMPRDIKYALTCRTCKTQVIAEGKEGRYVHDPRDGDAIAFKCPTCGNEMWARYKARSYSSW